MKALVVEDEKKIADFIRSGLKAEGYEVDCVGNGDDALAWARSGSYDAIVMDIMIPGRDGLSVLKSLRESGVNTPVVMVSARGELDDRVAGLNLGADDYLAKPFHTDELIARIRAVCRRTAGEHLNQRAIGDLTLNLATREVARAGEPVELTQREFALLELLSRSPGRVFTRNQILERVWSYDFDPNTNLVDVYIKRLRKKIDALGEPLIETVRGVGYKMRKADR